MKRILPLLLVVLLLPSLLAVPARADDYIGSAWIEALDYGFVSGTDNNTIALDPNSVGQMPITVLYELPSSYQQYYVDILIKTDADEIAATADSVGQSFFTVRALGNGLYRIIGIVDRFSDAAFFYFWHVHGSYLEILSYKTCIVPFARYVKSVTGVLYDYSYEPTLERSFFYDGQNPMTAIPINPSTDIRGGYVARMNISDWQSMDYIYLSIASWSTNFSSLKVSLNNFSVPYTLNTIESSDVLGVNLFLYELVIDLSNIDRTLGYPLAIDLTGQVKTPYNGTFAIQDCKGLVSVESPSPLVFWFTKLNSWLSGLGSKLTELSTTFSNYSQYIVNSLTSGFSALSTTFGNYALYVVNTLNEQTTKIGNWFTQQINAVSTWGQNIVTSVSTWGQNIVDAILGNRDGSQIQDDLNSAVGSLDQAGEAMNSVQRPDIGQFNFDVSTMVPASGISAVGSLVGLVYQNQVFGPIMLMFFTLSLAAFVIFGRR